MDSYQDRKRLKWMGFYLSEHTAKLAIQDQENRVVIARKSEMSASEINEVIGYALMKQQQVTIQQNKMVNGHFLPDTIGFIRGYTEEGLLVGDTQIELDAIRHIACYQAKKWSKL